LFSNFNGGYLKLEKLENVFVISADREKLKSAIFNIIGNAVKYTKEGGVTVKVRQSENCIRVIVSDTGIGISMEDINKLFQPFVQINSSLSRQYAGTGLGLNLVKKLAELHGGNVNVSSKIGEGSCFTVSFPYESG
jgi:signal transduction histidine kinase